MNIKALHTPFLVALLAGCSPTEKPTSGVDTGEDTYEYDDADRDGIIDGHDGFDDEDGDGTANFKDPDSDGDTILDHIGRVTPMS